MEAGCVCCARASNYAAAVKTLTTKATKVHEGSSKPEALVKFGSWVFRVL